MHGINWLLWATVLFFQNISFTYVSRARASGSLLRHLKASIFSNGIWIFSNMLMLGPLFDYLTGKHGLPAQVVTGLLYTTAAVSGSIFAHYLAMKTEKGKNAVGFNKKYAQIPVEDWDTFQRDVAKVALLVAATLKALETNVATTAELSAKLERTNAIALQAYDITVGLIPDSGIKAHNFDGAAVVTGIPTKG